MSQELDKDMQLVQMVVNDVINNINTVCEARFGKHSITTINFTRHVLINLIGNFTMEYTNFKMPDALNHNVEATCNEIKKWFEEVLKNNPDIKGMH